MFPFKCYFLFTEEKQRNVISARRCHETSRGSSTAIFNSERPTKDHEIYVPALARAHLAAESVISANKVSLGLKGVAGGQGASGGSRRGMPTLLQRPTLCSCNTYTRVHVRERMYGAHIRTYVRTCGRSFLRTRGGIIRSATINPNDDDAVMTLSRTSFQATSVTLRAHLPLFSPFSCRLFVSLSFVTHAYLYPDFHLYPSPSSSSALFLVLFSLSSHRLVRLARIIPPPSFSSFLFSPLRCISR